MMTGWQEIAALSEKVIICGADVKKVGMEGEYGAL
mgnify:CR=1 FL=1